MELNIRALGLTKISLSDLLGIYDEDEIKSIRNNILESGSYDDEWFDFYIVDHNVVDVDLVTEREDEIKSIKRKIEVNITQRNG